jgi:deoxyribodipyrimidine photo-lyase
MGNTAPVIWWVRRDLRLADNPALTAAAATGAPVIPVFVLDEVFETYGAAPRWRLGLGLDRFARSLADAGARLVLRRGPALQTLRALVAETGAQAVYWSRLCDPQARQRDETVKAALRDDGTGTHSFAGHLLFEPWTVQTGGGGFYRVFTPYWKAVRDRDVPVPLAPPARLLPPTDWPQSDTLDDWRLGAAMDRGAGIVAAHVCVGEAGAADRLAAFVAERIDAYDTARDLPAVDGTSRLSENLTYGEIGPRACWQAGLRARAEGKAGAETFLKELVWRDFAYHLAYHTPRLISGNWRPEWDAFPWRTDESLAEVTAWKQGRTGLPFVDAAQREMYVTGTMHNRGRMIVASYLTKHLMCHWQIGKAWFEDCLIDWDPASNAMGWQWSAGSGPDATPYFRVFNPDTQLDRFDKAGVYADRWIAEGRARPAAEALAYFEAVPRRWNLSPDAAYPAPIVSAAEGRKRALGAYERRDF